MDDGETGVVMMRQCVVELPQSPVRAEHVALRDIVNAEVTILFFEYEFRLGH